MPPKVIEFNHVIIYVSDVRKSLGFYQKALGFRLIEHYDGYARLRSTRGRTTLALHETEGNEPPPKSNRIVLYFEVKRLENVCRDLARDGVKFSQMPKLMPWGWTHAYLRDPDGHEISLYWAGRKRFEKTEH
jgi:catechol 2,3-dioxygenase-like lactoylglutathione lyase family enzyme